MVLSSLLSVVHTLGQAIPPETLTQTGIEEFSFVFIVLFAVVLYVVYALMTLVFGAVILAVGTRYVQRVYGHARNAPVRSGAIGVGAIVGAVVVYILLGVSVLVLLQVGAPEPTGLLLIIPVLVGFGFSIVVTTVGEIIVGAALLQWYTGEPEPNLWIALVIAALVVNLLFLIPPVGLLVGPLLIALATGAMVDLWWQRR